MKIEQLKAELFSQPWLVDEDWFRAFLDTFSVDFGSFDESTATKVEIAALQRIVQDDQNIGVVPISGPLFSKPNFLTEYFGIGTTYPAIQRSIQVLIDDDTVDSILMDVDSPGGVVTGVNALASFIKEVGAQKNINSYVSGLGASAAYWLMSPSKNITIDATARVGSIGVVASVYNPKESSIIEIVNSASPNKRPDVTTDAGKKVIVEELDALADVFIGTVAENREVSIKTVKSDFGKGGCLVGEHAKSAGMVDSVDFFSTYIEGQAHSSSPYNVKTYTAEDLENLSDETQIEEEIMDKKEFEAKYPEIFKAVQKDAVSAIGVKLTKAEEATTALQTKLDDAQTANTGLNDRVLNLEKADTMRSEKDLQNFANAMVSKSISGSNLPGRVHDKVAKQLDHNKFVKDDKLDKGAFQEAIDAEIKDWEETLSTDGTVIGSSIVNDQTGLDATDADAVADALFAHIS